MEGLLKYLMEAKELTPEQKSRLDELKDLLEGEKYENVVDRLNEMLKDPRLAAIIEDAFGGPLAEVDLKMSKTTVAAGSLQPTQNEIDFSKSLSRGLGEGCTKSIDLYFNPPVELGIPLITYNKVFIIDGHHRWSQVCCFNRKAKMKVINFEGDMSAAEFLKAVQGSIAATLLAKGEKNPQLPISVVKPGMNLLDMSPNELKQHIEADITDECVEALSKYVKSVTDKDSAVKYLVKNGKAMHNNNRPIDGASGRPYMPQTDKVEPRPDNDINGELKKRMTKTTQIK